MAIQLFNRWDVVVLPYPLAGPAGEIGARRRPGLIISADSLQRDYGLYWILMITSLGQADDKASPDAQQPADIVIEDWESAGLPVPSLVRTTKILTVQARQIIRPLGQLSPSDQSRVVLELSRFVG